MGAMTRALELAPHFAHARFHLGLLAIGAGRERDAQSILAPLLDLSLDDPLRHLAEGLGHLFANRPAEAAECLRFGLVLQWPDAALAIRSRCCSRRSERCRYRNSAAFRSKRSPTAWRGRGRSTRPRSPEGAAWAPGKERAPMQQVAPSAGGRRTVSILVIACAAALRHWVANGAASALEAPRRPGAGGSGGQVGGRGRMGAHTGVADVHAAGGSWESNEGKLTGWVGLFQSVARCRRTESEIFFRP